ncbi:hypothetical protein BC351_03970 [Paenibacillus ferrarius]|uniref:Heme sensor protein HssS n=1 Tax=Paenibacillus ferrarius TaxID=1469647 RepID=A0A1V4HKA7_9BACL|nr:HAMP domain-containing sensor histidine kinase [Paenibacillus ferrarius]OPH57680.1 hypothetical protein BC351_03970 [Paenibacillus ferrarius]
MTLYLRVVLTFLAVVVVSVLLAFFIAMLLYTNRITTELQASLLKAGNQLAEMSNEYQTTKLETLLEGSTKFNDSYSLFLFDNSGYLASFGVEKKNDMSEMDQQKVISVLQGNIYQNEKTNFIYTDFKQSTSLMIGIPLAVNGRQYALFLTPKVSEVARKQTRDSITTVLLIVLLVGSLLILVASRYIVSPMKKLTRATNRLARGNFNVNVNIQRNDEIGLLAEGFNHMAGELKQLEQMRQDFVSNVSHEIQSPLTSIRGFSKVLRQSALQEEERHRYLEIIERESERLTRLSENLLKLASLESEQHPFHPSTYNLDEQLRRVLVFYEPQWSEKEQVLDLNLPRVKISADADQLNQVWTNLLGNAIKFTPPQGIIQIKLAAKTDHVVISIQDTGIGIKKEEQERIFERFYKADHARQWGTGGSGLGLAIVRKILERHQGSISVASEPGEGTLFTVILPIITYLQENHK